MPFTMKLVSSFNGYVRCILMSNSNSLRHENDAIIMNINDFYNTKYT